MRGGRVLVSIYTEILVWLTIFFAFAVVPACLTLFILYVIIII